MNRMCWSGMATPEFSCYPTWGKPCNRIWSSSLSCNCSWSRTAVWQAICYKPL